MQLGRERCQEAGVEDHVELRVADYREISEEAFDAISSIGMVEHVGAERINLYTKTLPDLLRPVAGFLNHGIAKLPDFDDPDEGAFSERFVFPDGVPLPLHRSTGRWRGPGWSPPTSRACRDYAGPGVLDREFRGPLRRGGTAGGRGACARLAGVPARGPPQAFIDRLGVDLPGAGAQAVARLSRASTDASLDRRTFDGYMTD